MADFVNIGNGLTYGPAQSRYTRTPISFMPNSVNETKGPPPLLQLLPFLKNIITPAQINVNTSDRNPATALTHEDIHALMYQLFGNGAPPVTQEQKDSLAPSLVTKDTGAGLSKELPAYMGSFEPSQTPVAQDERDQFIKDFSSKLAEVSPRGAEIYKKLSRVKAQ